jgi:hypothetical protein
MRVRSTGLGKWKWWPFYPSGTHRERLIIMEMQSGADAFRIRVFDEQIQAF